MIVLGQGKAEIKKLQSKERAKIVNFANIKLWISEDQSFIERPSITEN